MRQRPQHECSWVKSFPRSHRSCFPLPRRLFLARWLLVAFVAAVALLSVFVAVLPRAASAGTVMSDYFTGDAALNTALWEVNGQAASAALPNFDSPAATLVAPDPSFSSAGMEMSGVTSDYQQGGIQSVQSFSASLTLTATVTPEAVGSGAFQLSLTSANGGSGVSIDGGSAASPGCW